MVLDLYRREVIGGIALSASAWEAQTESRSVETPEILGRFSRQVSERNFLDAAIMRRVESYIGKSACFLRGADCGTKVEIAGSNVYLRYWATDDVSVSRALLANAIAFGCTGAAVELYSSRSSFHWIAACAFGGITMHLFRRRSAKLVVASRVKPSTPKAGRLLVSID